MTSYTRGIQKASEIDLLALVFSMVPGGDFLDFWDEATLYEPKVRTLSLKGPKVWNLLLKDIKLLCSLA